MAPRWARLAAFSVALVVLVPPMATASELRLMMIEQLGCHWCAQWHAEIGPIYPKTDEGKLAPVFMQNIRDPLPEGISVTSPPQFTPTFILLQDGTEIDRISGYPGEDFFWGLLSVMLAKTTTGTTETANK